MGIFCGGVSTTPTLFHINFLKKEISPKIITFSINTKSIPTKSKTQFLFVYLIEAQLSTLIWGNIPGGSLHHAVALKRSSKYGAKG